MKAFVVTRKWTLIAAMIAALSLPLSPASAAGAGAGAKDAGNLPEESLRAGDDEPAALQSEAAARVLEWVAASNDNGDLPYMVIDKDAGTLFLADADGQSLGQVPVLTGVATGDDATPGIGSKSLAEIGPAEKTTPAGRFLARYGWAAGNKKVLWVDYATSVALHAVVTGNKKERRLERLQSPDADDNRITFGCINVPTEFYEDTIRPLFEETGGIVYVLPDTRPLEDVFPNLRVMPFL